MLAAMVEMEGIWRGNGLSTGGKQFGFLNQKFTLTAIANKSLAGLE
jgi:hypothetical protein